MLQSSCRDTCLVACGILHDEIQAIIEQQKWHIPIIYLAPAPCIDQAKFPSRLQRALERAHRLATRVVVVIGQCHPDIEELIGRHRAERLPISNCFEALLGESQRTYLREANTFFTTPTWLKHWRRALTRGMMWDEVDARQNFGVYERILLLDAGVTPYSAEEVLEFFDYVQVPVETVRIDLDPLTGLLRNALCRKK